MHQHQSSYKGKTTLTIKELARMTGISTADILRGCDVGQHRLRAQLRLCIRPPSGFNVFSVEPSLFEMLGRSATDPRHQELKSFLESQPPIMCQNFDLLVLKLQDCRSLRHVGSVDVCTFNEAIAFDQLEIPRKYPAPSAPPAGAHSYFPVCQNKRWFALSAAPICASDHFTSAPFHLAKAKVTIEDLFILVSDLSFLIDLNMITEDSNPEESAQTRINITLAQQNINAVFHDNSTTNNSTTYESRQSDFHAASEVWEEAAIVEPIVATPPQAPDPATTSSEITITDDTHAPTETSDTATSKSSSHENIKEEELKHFTDFNFEIHNHTSTLLIILHETAKEVWGQKYTDNDLLPTNDEVATILQEKHAKRLGEKLGTKPAMHMAAMIRPNCGRGYAKQDYDVLRKGRYLTNNFVILQQASDLFFGENASQSNPTNMTIKNWLMDECSLPEHLANIGARIIRSDKKKSA